MTTENTLWEQIAAARDWRTHGEELEMEAWWRALLDVAEAADAATLAYAAEDGRIIPEMERLGRVLFALSASLPEVEDTVSESV